MQPTGDPDLDFGIQAILDENFTAAFRRFTELADSGSPMAQHFLGWMYEQGLACEADDSSAFYWWSKSARQNIAESQHGLGVFYEEGRAVGADLPKAYYWFALAVRSGDEASMGCVKRVARMLTKEQLDEAKRQLADT
ncbi:MAG: tetratricopeptide repeat protein [Gammaproteobacteria bacterium]